MLESLILLMLVITLIATPLFFCPMKTLDGYILPQIGVAAIGMGIVVILFSCLGLFPLNLVTMLACLLLLYLFMTTFWSTSQQNALRELPLVFSYLAAFIVTFALFQSGLINTTIISLVVFFTAMATSAYGIMQKFRLDPLFKWRLNPVKEYENKPSVEIPKWFRNKNRIDTRPISTIGNTTFFAGYLIAALPFLVFLSVEVNEWFWVSIVVIIATIILTESRAATLGLLMGSVVFILLASVNGWVFDFLFYVFGGLDIGIVPLFCLLVVLLGGQVFTFVRSNDILKRLHKKSLLTMKLCLENSDQEDFVAHLRYRVRYWRAAFELIRQRPLQGFGLRSYRREVYQAQARIHEKHDREFLGLGYQTPQPREVHNDFIENFVEGGIVGGLLFLFIVGIIFYHALSFFFTATGFHQQLLIAAITSAMICMLFNAFFFFPLRLASSGILFWIALAMVESLTRGVNVISFIPNFLITLALVGMIAALIWEGSVKPNIGNWYFRKYNFSKDVKKNEEYLVKAMEYCPKETIFRTHAMMGYIDAYPQHAERHADAMKAFYDGMTPAWIMFYNVGLAKAVNQKWTEAMENFNHSLYYYPRFKASLKYIKQIWTKTPLPQKRIVSTKMSEEATGFIQLRQNEIRQCKSTINEMMSQERLRLNVPANWDCDLKEFVFKDKKGGGMKQLSQEAMNAIHLQQSKIESLGLVIENIVLQEKLKLNIPLDWPCMLGNGLFLSPKEAAEYERKKKEGQATPQLTVVVNNENQEGEA